VAKVTPAILSLIVLFLSGSHDFVLASDPPDSQTNPQTGFVETTDSYLDQTRFNIRHAIDPGGGIAKTTAVVSSSALDDHGARLVISSAGDTWVVWWRDDDKDGIFARKRSYSTGTWTNEGQISNGNEGSRHPEVVYDGTSPWVAYEYDDAGDTAIAVSVIFDNADPVGNRVRLASTSYAGDVDVIPHFESGHLWVTWVDSGTYVGWCEYDDQAETWSSPTYESFASDSVEDARERIRGSVVGD
jgi:hypothetical protein